MLLLAEKAPELYNIQAEAMKNVRVDKLTVVGGMNGAGGGADNALGKVASDYLSLLPSLHEGAKAFGLDLPAMMGKAAKPEGAAEPKTPHKAE